MVHVNWHPDEKTLREFSQVWMFFLGMVLVPLVLFDVGWFARLGTPAAVVLWCLAVAGRLVGMLRPGWLRWLFVGMSLVAWPIGWTVSHVALLLIYYFVFTPVALFFRLIGRDALERRLDRQAPTYWETHNPDHGLAGYLRQF